MGLAFRKTLKAGPDRVNLSKSMAAVSAVHIANDYPACKRIILTFSGIFFLMTGLISLLIAVGMFMGDETPVPFGVICVFLFFIGIKLIKLKKRKLKN